MPCPALPCQKGRHAGAGALRPARCALQGRQLAQDMYCRLGDYGAYCTALLRQGASAGAMLRALRAVHARRVDAIPPQAFLEAAGRSWDGVLFAGVYRFCRQARLRGRGRRHGLVLLVVGGS